MAGERKLRKFLLVFAFTWICVLGSGTVVMAGTEDAPTTQELEEKCGLREREIVEDPDLSTEIHRSVYVRGNESSYWTKFRSDYYYNQLSDYEQQMWDALEADCVSLAVGADDASAAMVCFDNLIANMSTQDLVDFLFMFRISNPQFYFLDSAYSYYASGDTVIGAIIIYDEFQNGVDRKQYTDTFCAKLDAWVGQVASAGRDEEKVRLAHDIIAANTEYGYGTYDQSAYSMVCEGQTVCAGYTAALQLLLIPNGVAATGVTSPGHAWNNVYVHGYWYAVDITWDDDQGEIYYDFYMKSDATMQYENNAHDPEAMWSGYLPELNYDSTLSVDNIYVSPYFTSGNYIYFKVNDNIDLGDRYVAAVDTVNGASLNSVPAWVQYDGNIYTVLQSAQPEPEPEEPVQTLNGLCQGADGNWYYYVNGAVDYSYTGMACNAYGWWYVTNGALDWGYTGMACNEYGWWYMTNGALDWNYTGMACNEYGWWYMMNGALDWNYTGMACNEYGWWYMTNGALDWNYTGMACNEYGWWYMTNGALNWNYTGMACNEYGWWYMTNGALDWGYTGMACNEYGWWYMTNGALDWGYTGMACNEYGWWYMTNGALDWGYTGMAKNEYGWWYMTNGALDMTYTGPAYNQYGEWHFTNGVLDQ